MVRGLFTEISVKIPPLREYWYFVNVDGMPPEESVKYTFIESTVLSIAVATRDDGAEPTRFVTIVLDANESADVHDEPANARNTTL
jgi:hypothetical protein